MTFSIVARCARTGQFGLAISSSSPAVAARCSHVRAGVGAAASQNITDPALGPLALDQMAASLSATDALKAVTEGRPHIDYRQLLVIDRNGQTAIHSGGRVLGIWGEARAMDCAAGGNLLADELVPMAMVQAFSAAAGHLGERLMQALEAGLAAGGEAGPVYSSGLKVSDRLDWPLVDLRIDWAEAPIAKLRAAWDVYSPQMHSYVQRAEDPTKAPSYGVPGNE